MSLPLLDEPAVSRALVQDWQTACADTSRARSAYAAYLQKRARPRSRLLVGARWVLVGMLTGIGSLYAADGAPLRWLGIDTESSSSSAPPLSSASPPRVKPHAVVVPPLPPPVVSPESVVTPQDSTLTVTPTVAPPAVTLPASKSGASEQWQRAAKALRESDFTRADAALRELVAKAQGSEREAAELAHAQLLLSNGRQAEALSTLRRLQQSASSGSVRRKAGELLARGQRSDASDRSFEGATGTN